MNSYYSILVLRGTQMRRFVVPSARLRELLLTAILLVVICGLGVSEFLAVQRQKLEAVVASGQSHREKLSILSDRAKQVQATLARWKELRGKLYASLPQRGNAAGASAKEAEELQQLLTAIQSELTGMIAALPADWPVQGAVISGVGMRASPFTGEMEYHSGLDIPKPMGTSVHAPGDAVVESIDHQLGNLVLNHGQDIKTQYSHLSKILVSARTQVRKGQPIAEVGNTGRSTGPHLHYEMRVAGVAIDPRQGLIGTR